jgi:hypothetical protein
MDKHIQLKHMEELLVELCQLLGSDYLLKRNGTKKSNQLVVPFFYKHLRISNSTVGVI